MSAYRLRDASEQFGVALLLVGSFALASCARQLSPPSPDVVRSWTRETLASMSLEEKVGQMIFARSDGAFVHENDPGLKELESLAGQGRIGGVVFFKGDPFSTAAIANHLQDESKLPLLMASDYEWGAAFRVDGTTRFPSAMALGAGGREEDIRFQAEVTAQEARALGIHLALAPVVDLNVNPANSVINYRSFGEDPERVGRLVAAFIQAAQENKLLTTAKHFPGHGPTEVDSHLSLPVIRLDRKRLEEVELAAFRAAIDAGVAAVMTAHIAVPALDGRDDRPATFSRDILERLLREEMGFEGLIASDALDMGGARGKWWGGEVAVSAVKAGVDLLLVPPDPRVAWDSVVRAVGRGDISLERIDRSVLRILETKARLNLHRERIVDLRDVPRRVGEPRYEEKVQQVADRSITLVSCRPRLLPLHAELSPRVLHVNYVLEGDSAVDPSVLVEELEVRTENLSTVRLTPTTVASRIRYLERLAETTDVVLLASYTRTRSTLGRGEVALELLDALRNLIAKGVPVILVSLGNPYVLTELPDAGALMAAYDFSPFSQRAVARALFGEFTIGGRLPVTLSARYPVGHGLDLERRPLELESVESPEEAGFSKEGLDRVVGLLEEAVASKAFPGGVVVVGRRGKLVLERPFGRLTYERNAPEVTKDTIYDLASVTKVVATTTVAMVLYERGELVLEKPVRDYIPEFRGRDKDRVTVTDLLAHTGGLLWWKDFYRENSASDPEEAKKKYIDAICRMPLDYAPRSESVYSDLGVILLGEILERVSGLSLDELAQQEVFGPLGMDDTTFNPPESLRDRIAPTEDEPWRGRMVRGEVHDENAYAMGGVAPHAGLFSTGSDLARFAQAMLNGGIYGNHRILRSSTLEKFTTRPGLVPDSSRALGWDTPSHKSSSGRYFSTSSFGHTGFTGSSLWIDPERDVFVVLLTNRVHPSRENRQISQVRPALHDAVMEAIMDVEVIPRDP
jgi:beta-glucosidase-like glycosyl hydrolase/CubicO group peptidase (beta-lactamase class C family)